MAANIHVMPTARGDVRAIAAYFDQQTVGLGDQFLDRFEECLVRIAAVPTIGTAAVRQYRKVQTNQFKYYVFFEFDGVTATVHLVCHTARSPTYWSQRLP